MGFGRGSSGSSGGPRGGRVQYSIRFAGYNQPTGGGAILSSAPRSASSIDSDGGSSLEQQAVELVSEDPLSRPLGAVWSFWSLPYDNLHKRRWLDDEFHLLSWSLSVMCAAEHFDELRLVTDTDGARLLVDRLELPFTAVSTTLDGLPAGSHRWWVLGKLRAYLEQELPFLHIDSDVYVWKALPGPHQSADVIAQHPEPAPPNDTTYYKPLQLHETFTRTGGLLPECIGRYMSNGGQTAFNVGVFGGHNLNVIHRYAHQATELITSSANDAAWQALGDPFAWSVFVEQYLLAAVCADMRGRQGGDIDIKFVFPSQEMAFRETYARSVGYTHLIASLKRSQHLKRAVANRLRARYPDVHERVRCVAAESTGCAGGIGLGGGL